MKEVHVWCGTSYGGGGKRPTATPPVPDGAALGPVGRPRADAALQPGVRAVQLAALVGLRRRHAQRHGLPLHGPAVLGARTCATRRSVEAEGPPASPEMAAPWLIVHYEFPARGKMPAVKLNWYDGGKRPKALAEAGVKGWGNGVLFVGEQGHAAWPTTADYKLLPEKDFAGFIAAEADDPRVGRPLQGVGRGVQDAAARRRATSTTPGR